MASPAMPDSIFAPVFLVGCPRSGTTLLQRLLDAHPLLAVAPETHFVRRFWLHRAKYQDLEQPAAFDTLVADIVAMPEFAEMGLDALAFANAALTTERTYPALFQLLLQSFAAGRGAAIVGEKTPNHLLYMPTLQEFFPAARFIHIIRDPRAVVKSWTTVPWSTGTIGGDAGVWRRYIQTAWTHPPRGAALHVVRYERLATDPERELRAICAFLGILFDPAMLAFHSREADTLNFAREPWKHRAAEPVTTEATDQWRTALTADQIGEIETLVWREMLRLGYRPSRPDRLLVPLAKRLARRLVRFH
jgi:hypothetical protein